MPPSSRDRKTTGSYYTPAALVERILDTTLQPLIAARMSVGDPEAALLALRVCDPSCGAGAFLVAACDRIAHILATVRTGQDEPPEGRLAEARRDVVRHCIYGVDLNPVAVELARSALWTLALADGAPHPFLGHRVKCGNALIGTLPALLKQGIPDAAFTPVEGDDPAVARELRRRNAAERAAAQGGLL